MIRYLREIPLKKLVRLVTNPAKGDPEVRARVVGQSKGSTTVKMASGVVTRTFQPWDPEMGDEGPVKTFTYESSRVQQWSGGTRVEIIEEQEVISAAD